MIPAELFRFCPRCGDARPADNAAAVPYRCGGCALVYYFNPTVAAAAWVSDPAGRVLLIRRAKDPARGKLAIPGGFVDAGETADQAVRRETREEVGLELDAVQFLTSFPNLYHYREVTYPVLDLVFTARAVAPEAAFPGDGVSDIEWHHPAAVDPGEVAFPSILESLKLLQK
ncbi:NUDIX domain-containing protein [bacterium]|nr:NUDIX domain-containing protein [bacterium]